MNHLPDPRDRDQCTYSQAHLLWGGILLFMMQLGSRRQLRFERIARSFRQHIALLAEEAPPDNIADPDTLAYYAERVDHSKVEKIIARMTGSIIRMKAFDPFLS